MRKKKVRPSKQSPIDLESIYWIDNYKKPMDHDEGNTQSQRNSIEKVSGWENQPINHPAKTKEKRSRKHK